jgi:hypothetical protein
VGLHTKAFDLPVSAVCLIPSAYGISAAISPSENNVNNGLAFWPNFWINAIWPQSEVRLERIDWASPPQKLADKPYGSLIFSRHLQHLWDLLQPVIYKRCDFLPARFADDPVGVIFKLLVGRNPFVFICHFSNHRSRGYSVFGAGDD